MSARTWTDEKATSVATLSVVLAAMSFIAAPVLGAVFSISLHDSVGASWRVAHLFAVPLALLVGAPAFALATLALMQARAQVFLGARRARIARGLALAASAVALLQSLIASLA